MNYEILKSIFRRSREYDDLVTVLRQPHRGRYRPYYVSGLTEGAQRIFLGTFCEDFRDCGDPVLLVCTDDKEAAANRNLLQAMGVNAALYPTREYNFNNMTASHDFENERLSVLSALYGIATGSYEMPDTPEVICTAAEALLQVTIPPDRLGEAMVHLTMTDAVDTAELTTRLIASGYTRVELVEGAGQFAIRGGIIDVYPPLKNPLRIELFGDEIDRVGYFDVESQRFTETLEGDILIPPAREILMDEEMRENLAVLIRRQIKRIGKIEEADERYSRACSVLSAELTAVEEGMDMPFADKYLPLIYPDGDCLLEYCDGMMILLDAPAAEERASASLALLEQSVEDMLENFEMPPVKGGFYLREWESVTARTENYPTLFIDALARSHPGLTPAGNYAFVTRHVPAYAGKMPLLLEDLKNYSENGSVAIVLCATEAEQSAVMETCFEAGYTVSAIGSKDHPDKWQGTLNDLFLMKNPNTVLTMLGEYTGGFEMISPKFVFLDFSASSVKLGRVMRGNTKKKKTATEAILSYADLEVGDLVVHQAYGIGQYMGLENLTVAGSSRDYVHIKYAGTDKLFLPVDQLDQVSKYIGAGSDTGMVKLSKMGGADWTKAKTKAKAATKEMAKELIELYARRKRTPGFRFDPDDEMCREFADSFEYEETDGQLAAISDIRSDMEAGYPMDRLLCGDVGYGKTEVAMRAAFKAVMRASRLLFWCPQPFLPISTPRTF
ncbi:MAG: hypothetical protein IKY52_01820 [Clostridia bacterium]|nr:hypothetical protein [Clostridia bacterium]